MHRSFSGNPDPLTRELNEVWPGGRTNHYWFDLNRDWLPVQLPESIARIKKFQEWKPNVLTDHHEMGNNKTFFFQPGIPSRNNPLTPASTYRLTAEIASYHAYSLDKIGSLYYSEEDFDDFYYGKGSTYPDINGGIGILFEQASSRGFEQMSDNGILRFPFTIKNQFITSLSTLKAGQELRPQLNSHMIEFYRSASELSSTDLVKAYVFNAGKDQYRMQQFLKILQLHQLEVYRLKNEINVEGRIFDDQSFLVPLAQPEYRLVKTIFDKVTDFSDSLFYDVSSWTLPLAFNLNYAELNSKVYSRKILGEKLEQLPVKNGGLIGGKSDYAYVLEGYDYQLPEFLYEMLQKQLKIRVATNSFSWDGTRSFSAGSILIPVGIQDVASERLHQMMKQAVEKYGFDIYAVSTGLTMEGIDLGSEQFQPLREPKALMLVGSGIYPYDAGEVWHLLDQRVKMPFTLADLSRLSQINLHNYNTLILADGNYPRLSDNERLKIKNWIQEGGLVVAMKRGAKWLNDNQIINLPMRRNKTDSLAQRPYLLRERYKGAQEIGGAIFTSRIDLSHPLAYGFQDEIIPVFRNGDIFIERHSNPYANPVMYTQTPILSGYISNEKLKQVAGSAAVAVNGLGKGRVISFSDNPNFRAFWYGTSRLFLNSIFYGPVIDKDAAP